MVETATITDLVPRKPGHILGFRPAQRQTGICVVITELQ